jgi:STE24 endopeptidase
MNIYLILILITLVVKYMLDFGVDWLNVHHLEPALPEEFKGFYDKEKYFRSQQYTRGKTVFGLIQNTITTAFIMAFILTGGFNVIDQLVRKLSFGSILTGLIYILFLILVSGILDLPFRIYSTFVIEEKYGFNKTTPLTFILDLVKGFLLLLIIGGPLLAMVLWFFQETGRLAPLYVWIAVSLFQIFLTFIAPVMIMPLFNKFIPLEKGELRSEIERYARDHNFKLKGIYTMDGSKRSAKSNAFFTGFGRSRRIVLFDTLVENHTADELVGVLAHEMGHYKLGHIFKMMVFSILETGLLLFLLSFLMNNQYLFAAFKMEQLSIYASLIFFGFLYAPVSTLLSVFTNVISRKYEYSADRFAVQTTKRGEIFVQALKKLSADNLSNLTPHPLKVFLFYSHPPVLERIQAIRQLKRV